MSESYEIEPWDSTSTMRYPTGKPMPGEAEGLGVAAGGMLKTGAQMLNPVEALYGLSHAASGIANDGVRLLGGTPREDAPSFAGDLKDAAVSAYNQPVQTAFDMVTAPGSIPGMFTGLKVPNIPKGSAYKLLRSKPGYSKLAPEVRGMGRYSYNPYEVNNNFNKGRPYDTIGQSIRQERPNTNFRTEHVNKAPDQTRVAHLSDGTSKMEFSLTPEERLRQAKDITQKDVGDAVTQVGDRASGVARPEIDSILYSRASPDKSHTIRHEVKHLLHPAKDSKFSRYMDEANANIVGEKSVSGGLEKWGLGLRNYNNGGYSGHGSKRVGVATHNIGKAGSAIRKLPKPAGMVTGPLVNYAAREE